MATVEESRAVLRKLSPTPEKVEQAVAIVIKTARPSRVFIFGSWARGEAQWDSDLDLAVLVPDEAEKGIRELRGALRQELEQIPMKIDLVIATESYAALLAESINHLFHDVFQEGRLIYDSQRTGASCNDSFVA